MYTNTTPSKGLNLFFFFTQQQNLLTIVKYFLHKVCSFIQLKKNPYVFHVTIHIKHVVGNAS